MGRGGTWNRRVGGRRYVFHFFFLFHVLCIPGYFYLVHSIPIVLEVKHVVVCSAFLDAA